MRFLKVLKLKSALCGLKQAPRAWQKHLVDILKNMGFNQAKSDSCLFLRPTHDSVGVPEMIVVHVDDGLTAVNDHQKFISELGKYLKVQNLNIETDSFLGREIRQDVSAGISWLTQGTSILSTIHRYHMTDAKGATQPMEAKLPDHNEIPQSVEEEEEGNKLPFFKLSGSTAISD